ncbi:hypothetical protein [Nocardioides sp.]|uniref:pilus assembly PilX family protein n=1 Tax=Nocardioides sp. TaxID=35761 RepID=UPI0035654B96
MITDRRRPDPHDRGAALVVTMMIVALVVVLATTVMSVTVNNLGSARRSADAALALDAADAGVAQALAYLRRSGVRRLSCSPTCPSNSWGNSSAPTQETINAATRQAYAAWIEQLAPVTATQSGRFRVHSLGTGGKGVRSLEVDVEVATLTSLPLGVFARSVSGGGSASVTRESIFTTGCVWNRSKIDMTAGTIDAAYGIPVAVHSSRYISDSNGHNQNCAVSSGAIHKASACHPDYPYDQDNLGGSLTSTSCSSVQTNHPTYYAPRDLDGDGTTDVNGSWIKDDASLRKLFGISTQAFTSAQLDDLRATARSQGTYFTSATGFTSPDPATTPHAVMFFDLAASNPGAQVDLNNVNGWGRTPGLTAGSAQCLDRSLLIVIDGGNAKLNSNQTMTANLVLTSPAPYGSVDKANGTANFIGTIFADTVNLVGNLDISLDECFLANLSPSLLSASTGDYREIDR